MFHIKGLKIVFHKIYYGHEFEPDCQWPKINTARNAALDHFSNMIDTV